MFKTLITQPSVERDPQLPTTPFCFNIIFPLPPVYK